MSDQKASIKAILDKHDFTVESVFVPWSQSRNAGERYPSLNWIITLKHNGRKILSTDYMAGSAHAPGYKQGKQTWDDAQLIKKECETGFACVHMWSMGHIQENKKKPILPDREDVIYSLLMDSEVLDYTDYEDWAGCFGYDPDSRSGEKIYQACMKIALQLRTIGESVLSELREACQDY
jgi:hypothetical protein